MENFQYLVKGRKIEIDWLKGSKYEVYSQYVLNAFYLCLMIEEENQSEIENINKAMVLKFKQEDQSLYILSLEDQQKEYIMEKKSKTFNKTLQRRLVFQDMKMIQQKDKGGKIEKKQFPIHNGLTIEIKDESLKQQWKKEAANQSVRINIHFQSRKPIIVYFDDRSDAIKIRDAFVSSSILKQLNLLDALNEVKNHLKYRIIQLFKEKIQEFAQGIQKKANCNKDSIPEENNHESDDDQNVAQMIPRSIKNDALDQIKEVEVQNQGDVSSGSLKFGIQQYKEEIDEEELEQELNNFDVSKSFQNNQKVGGEDSQENQDINKIISNFNLDEEKKESNLRLDTQVNDKQDPRNTQLTLDLETRTTQKERPKDINAEQITEQMKEKYTKFCKNLVLEHAVEELNHVSQVDHPEKMVKILKQTILKLKEGIKVIMFLCNERKNMITLIENQQETIEKQIDQMNQMNLSEKLSKLDENFFKNQLSLLNTYLKQFYHLVQNCQKSIEILEQTFKYDPEWRQDPRYKNQNILSDMEELPKHCFKIHQFHSDKLKEVKKLYDQIVKQDENEVKYIEYTQADIKQTVEVLKPLSEHFEHNSTTEFEILFFLFIEDFKQLNDKFQSSYSKQQENINQFKKSYEDIRNFYYQRLQRILELKYQNNVTKQKLMRIVIPTNSKVNNAILTDGLESIQYVDKQLDQVKLDLNQPMSEGSYFQQIKLYEEHNAHQIIKEFENEIANLKQVFQTVTQIEMMEKTIEKLSKLREEFDNDEIEEEDKEIQAEQYKQLITIVEKYTEDMVALIEISPVFRSFHSRLSSEIQLSKVVLELIDLE
ncbi:hypothetical protein ABPG72_020739 [Tetrahymena utriculariae]